MRHLGVLTSRSAVTGHEKSNHTSDFLMRLLSRRRMGNRRLRNSVLILETMESRLAPATLNLDFSTYLGGTQFEQMRDVAVDDQGNIYVTGGTDSPTYPTTPGAYQSQLNPGTSDGSASIRLDVFVTKFSPSGQIIWSTLIGGPNYDRAYAIELDDQGNIYIGGRAGANFPVTAGAVQTTFMGGAESFYGRQDGFVAKLSPDGSQLLWATYFGTPDSAIIRDIDVDMNGDVYLAAGRYFGSYPATVAAAFAGGFQSTPQGGTDIAVAKIKSDGTQMYWATYLGGSLNEVGTPSIRVDPLGRASVLFGTNSTNMPTSIGAYDRTQNGDIDLYLGQLSADGSTLINGTYYGGAGEDSTETHSLAIDAQGNHYLAAFTTSTNLPMAPGAFQPMNGGGYEGFVAKLSPDCSQLLASTYLGGSSSEGLEGIGIDSAGNVYVCGSTSSGNFPVTPGAFQPVKAAGGDAFVTKLSPSLALLYSTFLGGNGDDQGRGLGVGPGGVFFGGSTASSNWPTLNPMDPNYDGNTDTMLVRLGPLPTVTSVQVNDGSAQRSRVTSVTVTFSEQVNFATSPAAAFRLVRNSDGLDVVFSANVSIVNGRTEVTLGNFTGSTTGFGSLADGRYTLTVLAQQVTAHALPFDGNGDGTGGDNFVHVGGPSSTPKLFRLFGDSDGSGFVNAIDFAAFRTAFGTSSFAYDSDQNGVVNSADFAQFRQRFGVTI